MAGLHNDVNVHLFPGWTRSINVILYRRSSTARHEMNEIISEFGNWNDIRYIYIIYRCISTFPCNTKRNYYILSSLSYPKHFKDLNFLSIFVPSSLKEIRFRIKFISVRDSWNSDNFKSQLSELAETSIPIPYPVRTRGIRLFDTGVRLSTASHNFRVIAICSCDGTDLSPRFSSF